MAKFMIIVPPLTGHINPTLGLGASLIAKGHEVAWICLDPEIEKKIPMGGKYLPIKSSIGESEKERIKKELEALGKQAVYGLESLKFLYEQVLVPMNDGILPEIEKLIDSFSPSVIINDLQMFVGTVVAIQRNIPYATSVTTPAAIKTTGALPMVHQWESQQVIAFQKKHGINEENRLDCSPQLTLVYTSKPFFGDEELPSNYKFIGPSINRPKNNIDFDWDLLNSFNNPYKVLVSIGTTFDHSQKQQFFEKIKAAFSDEKITVIVVSEPNLFEEWPTNFIVSPRVPQLELIPLMDAVICHGGQNTVCESLSHAKPLIILPIAYDQSYVASCVTNNNAGIRLNFNRFKPIQLKEALTTLLEKEDYKRGAQHVQKSFIDTGGIEQAVSYLEQIVNKKIK